MPSVRDILASLHAIANQHLSFAILWHALFYLALAGLAGNWRPSNRMMGLLLVFPAVSVAVLSWTSGNPFNATLFGMVVVLTGFFTYRTDKETIQWSTQPFHGVGLLLVIYGLVYPHFLDTGSYYTYLFAAPVGLIPCPTLAVMTGFLLMMNGLGSRPLASIVAAFGLFYGTFGILRLGIWLDAGLLAGALTLLVFVLGSRIASAEGGTDRTTSIETDE